MRIRERCKSRDAVISVKDRIIIVIQHEESRGRDATVYRNQLAELRKSLPPSGDVHEAVVETADMPVNKSVDSLLGEWFEANRREGHFTPFPLELSNILDALSAKQISPNGSAIGVLDGMELPSDFGNERPNPNIENLIRHLT